MEKNEIDRVPFRVESPRGDDTMGTNTNTGTIISDHEAKTRSEPFQPGIPRDQIQKAIEDALKKEKWVCIEKQDGSTELLTKKDIPITSDEKPDEAAAVVKAEQPKEPPQPAKEDWKEALKPVPAPAKNPAHANQTTAPNQSKPKEEWVSKFASIKSATATHKGKGG
jgi:hypothetical protein